MDHQPNTPVPIFEEKQSVHSKDNKKLLESLDQARNRALLGISSLETHPWYSFGHPDLHQEEFESLIRCIRYLSIHLNKFWVEVQSCPIFLKTHKVDSVQQFKEIIEWLISSPRWNEIIDHPKVIPELTIPASRKALFEYMRNVQSARTLQTQILSQLNYLPDPHVCQTACQLAKGYAFESWIRSDLEYNIEKANTELNNLKRISQFFSDLSQASGFKKPSNSIEAQGLLWAIKCIQQMPQRIWSWRHRQIVGPTQKIRIQAWQDRARPILELRKKLNKHFKLEQSPDLEKLQKIEIHLKAPKLFYGFTSGYREAVGAYQGLRRIHPPGKKLVNESRLEMSQRISDWLNYIELSTTFRENTDARNAFEPHFQGIDTDFSTACDTNDWACSIRRDLSTLKILNNRGPTKDEVDEKKESNEDLKNLLLDYVFFIPLARIQPTIEFSKADETQVIHSLLDLPEFLSERPFDDIQKEIEFRLLGMLQLLDLIKTIGLKNDIPFSALENLYLLNEEVIFMKKAMGVNIEMSPYLKSKNFGVDSDLKPIKQGLEYIKFIGNSNIPDSLKAMLLTVHGPQRMADTSKMVSKFLPSLALLDEHFLKIENLTRGQIKSLYEGKPIEQAPIQFILERFQYVLKYPDRLVDWIDYLKIKRSGEEHQPSSAE